MPRIAINGFGRIGRTVFKIGYGQSGFDVVAINDLTETETLASLLRLDSAYGRFDATIAARKQSLVVDGHAVPVFAEKDPAALPWKKLGVDVVLECTGRFTDLESASAHLTAGAKRVIISAPAKGDDIPTYLLGVNDAALKKETHAIINNASCTTNCAAPVTTVLHEAFGIKKAILSTVHAYTADQNLQDGPHRDLRRARAAAFNIVPTSTGAAIAVTEVVPALKGKFGGLALRVPVLTGSLMQCVYLFKRRVTVAQVNAAFVKASKMPRWKNILAVSNEPLVSSDCIGSSLSATVDLGLTMVVDGDLVQVVAWYDNEWGYANRLAELALRFGRV